MQHDIKWQHNLLCVSDECFTSYKKSPTAPSPQWSLLSTVIKMNNTYKMHTVVANSVVDFVRFRFGKFWRLQGCQAYTI